MSSNERAHINQLLTQAQGSAVEAIRIIGFVIDDKANVADRQLELRLETGQFFHLQPAADGETLRISQEPWREPFEEPITEINAAFIKQHGKWSVLDPSSFSPVVLLVGQQLNDLLPVLNQADKLIGLQLRTQRGCVNYLVEWDEGHLLAGCEDYLLAQKGYHLG